MEDSTRSLADSYVKAYKTLDSIVPPGAVIWSYLIEKWRETEYWEAIEDITERFSMGETVGPYLSHGANSARQLDFLLDYCGMHHAHLSTVNGKLGKKRRTDKLLFFVVTRESHVWYLDIRDHPPKGDQTAWLYHSSLMMPCDSRGAFEYDCSPSPNSLDGHISPNWY